MEDKWKKSFSEALSDYEGDAPDLSWDKVRDAYDVAAGGRTRRLPVYVAWLSGAAAVLAAVVLLLPGKDARVDDMVALVEKAEEVVAGQDVAVAEEPAGNGYGKTAPGDAALEKSATEEPVVRLTAEDAEGAKKQRDPEGAKKQRDAMRIAENLPDEAETAVDLKDAGETAEKKTVSAGTAEDMQVSAENEGVDPEVGEAEKQAAREYWARVEAEERPVKAGRGTPVSIGLVGGTASPYSARGGGNDYSGGPVSDPVRMNYFDGHVADPSPDPVYGEEGDAPSASLMSASPSSEISRESLHRLPVRLGISARIGLGPRLSVTTGVTYTLLRSDFTENHSGCESVNTRKLSYIGIPVAASLNLFSAGGFSLYANAGARFEKLVCASVDSRVRVLSSGVEIPYEALPENSPLRPMEKPSGKGVQFALEGSLGLEYMFDGRWGISLEPGTVWYVPRGSGAPEDFYTAHPLAFDVTLGLRYRFGGK